MLSTTFNISLAYKVGAMDISLVNKKRLFLSEDSIKYYLNPMDIDRFSQRELVVGPASVDVI